MSGDDIHPFVALQRQNRKLQGLYFSARVLMNEMTGFVLQAARSLDPELPLLQTFNFELWVRDIIGQQRRFCSACGEDLQTDVLVGTACAIDEFNRVCHQCYPDLYPGAEASMLVARITALGQDRPETMAAVIALHGAQDGLEDTAFLNKWGLSRDQLMMLALCQRPSPDDQEAIVAIAKVIACEEGLIHRLLQAPLPARGEVALRPAFIPHIWQDRLSF